MRTAVLKGIQDIQLEDRPIPEVSEGEVLIKVECCGICGSDVHAYKNLLFPAGTVLGHEFSGTVAQIGPSVSTFAVGDRIVARPPGICGKCYWCKRGQLALCVEHFDNTLGLKIPGGFAEYVVAKEFQAVPLPESVSFEEAAILEPLAVCIRGIRNSQLELGDDVVVIGAGPIGLITMMCAFKRGAARVFVVEKSQKRRDMALALGATNVLPPEKVFELKKETDIIDLVYDCVGSSATLNMGVDLVRNGGQILILGATQEQATYNQTEVLVRAIDFKHSMGYFVDDFDTAVKCASVGMFPLKELVSDVYALERIKDGFVKLMDTDAAVKILIKP